MKTLIVTSELGKGGSAVLNALPYDLLVSEGNYCHPDNVSHYLRFRREHKRYDNILALSFPSYIWASYTDVPTAWYCFEPQFYIMRDKTTRHKLISRLIVPYEKRRVKKGIQACIVADEANRKRFEEVYDVNPHVVPYGIDYTFWSRTPPRDPHYSEFVIAHIAEMQPFKNQLKSLQVLNELLEYVPNARLLLIGKQYPPYMKVLNKYIKDHCLQPHVSILPETDRYRLSETVYPYIDCVIHPIKLQGGFLVPLEASASNRPVIVSPECSCSDIIERHDLGMVAYTDDDWLSVLIELSEGYDYSPNREWIRDNLTWRMFRDGVEKVLEDIT
jgi:glycosyltransferase involved in cell wall biosynthesis